MNRMKLLSKAGTVMLIKVQQNPPKSGNPRKFVEPWNNGLIALKVYADRAGYALGGVRQS